MNVTGMNHVPVPSTTGFSKFGTRGGNAESSAGGNQASPGQTHHLSMHDHSNMMVTAYNNIGRSLNMASRGQQQSPGQV